MVYHACRRRIGYSNPVLNPLKMQREMNYRNILDNWVAFIGGVYGGGMGYTLQVAWHAEAVKLAIAAITALIAGAMGVVGKYLVVWGWKSIKTLLKKQKHE
jgi:hypothetical protein